VLYNRCNACEGCASSASAQTLAGPVKKARIRSGSSSRATNRREGSLKKITSPSHRSHQNHSFRTNAPSASCSPFHPEMLHFRKCPAKSRRLLLLQKRGQQLPPAHTLAQNIGGRGVQHLNFNFNCCAYALSRVTSHQELRNVNKVDGVITRRERRGICFRFLRSAGLQPGILLWLSLSSLAQNIGAGDAKSRLSL
jgi:hypothetical protein